MVGIGSLVKLVRGGLSPDELLEILSSAGIDAQFLEVSGDGKRAAFETTAQAASLPGCSLVRIEAKMQNGARLSGLLAMNSGAKKIAVSPNLPLDSTPVQL
jgi:hypothetical protein